MATITTNQFLDGGTARTAGEVMTINGGILTVRTDTRWHANAPASMTGTLGGSSVISATLGGGLYLDGTAVRWMPFTGGSGTVPAIGTSVSRSGASGYLLGVWASLTSAPTAVAAAMPATGFIKFREVTGGPFTAGALTGITATAASPDVAGWIEVVCDQLYNLNVPRLGEFKVRGDWFYLDNTTGVAGQVLQVPTNGGGVGTEAPGCWIETGPSTGIYDFFPSLRTSTGWASANLSTDARCKFVQNIAGGQLRIGNDGTTAMGFLPPAGCRVRIPNVIGRQCATGTRAVNAAPSPVFGSRPDFTTTNSGAIDCEYFYNDWYFYFSQPYSVRLHHFATFDAVNIIECATAINLWDGFAGMYLGNVNSLLFSSNFAGGIVSDWSGQRFSSTSNAHDISVSFCNGITFERVRAGIINYARATGQPWYINQCANITINDCRSSNGGVLVNTSTNVTVNNHDHVDRYRLGTIATTPYYAVQFTNACSNVKVEGMTFGMQGLIANVHPYNGLVSYSANSGVKVRNIGTRSAFLDGGSANNPAYIVGDLGNNVDVKVQRCYMTPTRTGAHLTVNSTKNVLLEDVYGDFTDVMSIASLNTLVRGGGGTNTVTGQAAVYGTHFGGAFTSDTTGRMWLALNEPTAETLQYTARNFSAGSGFTSAGGLSLATVGDYFICEMQESRLQTTGFANNAATITGTNTGNHSYEYQIDTGDGNGWNGVWKTINGANLSAETINPALGYKLKFKVQCTVANNANLVSFVRCDTTSTLAAQIANLYPLDTTTITFTGLPTGCDVVVLDAGTTTIREQADAHPTTSYAYTYAGTPTVDIGFIKPGYIPFYIRNLPLGLVAASIPVSLTPDRNYTA